MRHAWVMICVLSAAPLSGCAPGPDNRMTGEYPGHRTLRSDMLAVPFSNPGWHTPHEFWIYEESLHWHQDFFDQRELHHLVMP